MNVVLSAVYVLLPMIFSLGTSCTVKEMEFVKNKPQLEGVPTSLNKVSWWVVKSKSDGAKANVDSIKMEFGEAHDNEISGNMTYYDKDRKEVDHPSQFTYVLKNGTLTSGNGSVRLFIAKVKDVILLVRCPVPEESALSGPGMLLLTTLDKTENDVKETVDKLIKELGELNVHFINRHHPK